MTPILLHAQNASAWTGPTGNNTWLLPGRVPALVDAGVGHPAHLAAIEEALGGTALATVLITHGHPDHVTGLPALVERWPSSRIVRFPTAADGVVAVGDGQMRVIPTPGHSPDHLCFFDEQGGDLYCGDLVRAGGTIVIPASRGGNLQQYLESLRSVRDIRPRRLLPGHGPIIDDPAALIETYLRHREERERQIVEALRAGATTPEEIATRIYEDLPPAIAAAAADSVLAHLIKTGGGKSGNEQRRGLAAPVVRLPVCLFCSLARGPPKANKRTNEQTSFKRVASPSEGPAPARRASLLSAWRRG